MQKNIYRIVNTINLGISYQRTNSTIILLFCTHYVLLRCNVAFFVDTSINSNCPQRSIYRSAIEYQPTNYNQFMNFETQKNLIHATTAGTRIITTLTDIGTSTFSRPFNTRTKIRFRVRKYRRNTTWRTTKIKIKTETVRRDGMECAPYKREQPFWRALGAAEDQRGSAAVTRACITWPVRSSRAPPRRWGTFPPSPSPNGGRRQHRHYRRECVELDRRL